MNMNLTIATHRRAGLAAKTFAVWTFAGLATWACAANAAEQQKGGDDWQILSTTAAPVLPTRPIAPDAPAPLVANATVSSLAGAAAPSLHVASVMLPGTPSAPSGDLTLTITPQDTNLRNALDRWLQTQGWQLAWKIDDDLPLEFNATFTGDFTSVLTQVMKATNHMRTPTRICRHTNKVIRVVARAANCQD